MSLLESPTASDDFYSVLFHTYHSDTFAAKLPQFCVPIPASIKEVLTSCRVPREGVESSKKKERKRENGKAG